MNIIEILEALRNGEQKENGQPLFAEGRSPEKWLEIKTTPFYKEMLQEVYREAEKYLKHPISSLPYSLYRIFDDTGSRKEYEKVFFERRARLNTFAILSMADGRREYVTVLQDTIWAICDEYTWCVPAHLGGKSTVVIEESVERGGKVKAAPRKHRETVDLFAAETGFALAEILSLLEDKLEPLVVYRAKKEIRERILLPYSNMNPLFGWETCTNNWAAVCAGSVGAAALYLIEDDEVLALILGRVLNTMECFLMGYKDDGACTEGLSYWNYGFGFFVFFAELLKQKTAGAIDLMRGDKIREIALFQQKCYLSGNHVISFSDSIETAKHRIGLSHFLKKKYQEIEIPDIRYKVAFTDDHCYRWAHAIRDFIWSDSRLGCDQPGEATYYLKDSQYLITRKRIAENMVCFAAKCGHNGEPHNHNDVGSFLLHVNGETLLTDIGRGEYTKQYFGPQRYTIFCNGSQGHSVPIVEEEYQAAGGKFKGEILDVKLSRQEDSISMDIAGAYGSKNLKCLIRTLVFRQEGEGVLRLKDVYEFGQNPKTITERFVSFYKPVIAEDGQIMVQGEKGGVEILYNGKKLQANVQRVEFIRHNAEPRDVYAIDLYVKNPNIKECVEVTFKVIGLQ